MDSTKLTSILLILTLFTPTLSCPHCPPTTIPTHPPTTKPIHPPTHKPHPPRGPIVHPPVFLPPVIGKPPSTGNVPCPPSPTTPSPVTPTPTPVTPTPTPVTPVTPTPSAPATCPIDTLKLGACVDLLGGLVHIGVGDPAVNQCCPLLEGLVEIEAAVCLCTTIRLKLLNINLYLPLALQLLLTCGKTPPPGYTCTI